MTAILFILGLGVALILTACPSCQSTPDDFSRCDYCGSEGRLFKGAVS